MDRLVWKDGCVISMKLGDNLYSLAQMRTVPFLQFYAVSSEDGHWSGVDLSAAASLFCVSVSDKRLKPLMAELVSPDRVLPDRRDMPRRMINAALNFDGGYPFMGGDLIQLDERCSTVDAPIVQSNLAVGSDDAVIREHELTNMWVEPDKLKDRLVRYFETGINWDVDKDLVFPGISV